MLRGRGSLTGRVTAVVTIVAAVTVFAGGADAGQQPKLPPGTLRGPIGQLQQYPDVSLATTRQRAAAERFLSRLVAGTRRWRDPRAAARAGFVVRRAKRRPGNTSVQPLHAESRRFKNDGRTLDPRRPEVLVYASAPGFRLTLIGVMFSVERGAHGRVLGGPITRWHTHQVCVRGVKRGVAPLPGGGCPRGTRLRQGSEMLHVWFTNDLRSAYAAEMPGPELCRAGLVPPSHCTGTGLICSLDARD